MTPVVDPPYGIGQSGGKNSTRSCKAKSQDYVGYEIDKEYFCKQEERFANYAAQQSLFIQDEAEQKSIWGGNND